MRTRQLVDLRADIRKRCDLEGSTTFLPDADVTELFNQGWARIYGILCTTGENYYLSNVTFSTVSGQDTYYTTSAVGVPSGTNLLPTDMWRVKGLDVQVVQTGLWNPAYRFQFGQRDDFQQWGWNWPAIPKYDYRGSGATASIVFAPIPSGVYPCRLWYYPSAVRLANDSDTIDGGNGWEIYAIDWAARRAAEKDENYELCARLDMALAEMERSIRAEAASRNAGLAPKIRRSRYRRSDGFWGGGWGEGGGYGP